MGIIDSLSYNIDMCDFILFMTKIHPIPNIDVKKVNVDTSYLETTTNTLVFSYTEAGIMEQLLDTELSTSGGLQVVGWLEGPTGNVYSQKPQEFQEPGIQRQSGLDLRAGLRPLRPGPHVGETAELHLPVSAGNQETDEEIRSPRPSFRLHLPEFVPQVLLRRQRSVRLTSTYSDLICSNTSNLSESSEDNCGNTQLDYRSAI